MNACTVIYSRSRSLYERSFLIYVLANVGGECFVNEVWACVAQLMHASAARAGRRSIYIYLVQLLYAEMGANEYQNIFIFQDLIVSQSGPPIKCMRLLRALQHQL